MSDDYNPLACGSQLGAVPSFSRCGNPGEVITLRREREGGIAYVYCAYHARICGVYRQGEFPIVPCPRTKGGVK